MADQKDGEEAKLADGEKRTRFMSRKALQNAVDAKRRQMTIARYKLSRVMQAVEGLDEDVITDIALSDLMVASDEFKSKLQELYSLYEQDKYNDFKDEALLDDETRLLKHAYTLIEIIKVKQTDKSSETSSCRSHYSRLSRSSASTTSSASLRLKALAEVAAARQSAEYERLAAEKELEIKEIEQRKEEDRARCQRDLAILTANKKLAVADARLKAIEQAMEEEDNLAKSEISGIPNAKREGRTSDWVNIATPPAPHLGDIETQTLPLVSKSDKSQGALNTIAVNLDKAPSQHTNRGQQALDKHIRASTPISDDPGAQLIETLTSTNKQIVAGLARQNLPKCHPDTFNGDATLFHPWKTAFKAMIKDACVSPAQEINYLRSFTSGEVQRLVDNFRKRQQRDPVTLLKDMWSELRLQQTASFSERDNAKLQQFVDLCADVESQLLYLPGLACLNYPNTIQPIAERLPASLRGKWEKDVAKYRDRNGGQYPGFDKFSKLVGEQARIGNNPNILAGRKAVRPTTNPTSPRRPVRQALATNTTQGVPKRTDASTEKNKDKRCPFHERDGHNLAECKAFAAKSLQERTEWIRDAKLCYRCLRGSHIASRCTQKIKCSICGDERHIALLHKPKQDEENETNIGTKCTAVCGVTEGGVSCSKIVLVDAYSKEKPDMTHRIYAIIDEQSNSSLISSELADIVGADGPAEKYYLSTCSTNKEVKFGRRVTGIAVRGMDGTTSELPTLIECDHIPQDKKEIPTPEMARRFAHLKAIATEIPPVETKTDIHLLIGRDAPELLKVRAFRNGPRGGPWAQKLSLGWTVMGQMCLDLVNGPAHVRSRHTRLLSEDGHEQEKDTPDRGYELEPCPNHFRIKESLVESDVFRTTREDNEPSLSVEDRKFLEIMENGVHKNENGNWEMPLPFRKDVIMPDNRNQALHRLNGLLRTLHRKPQMNKDYIEFMGKILKKGHASPVNPSEDATEPQPGKKWYLPHFGVYHPKKPTQIRVVFDSSAEHKGVSLNKELLAGPDLMNNLLGVLVRFRKENVAVMCDVEQMFHSFHVNTEHRDFLRFLWFKDNTPGKPIIEYRMNVHLFGNGPSPAVATFGLRKTASDGEEEFGKETANFVHRNFYVDDGLASLPTAEQAVQLVTNAQAMLATANLRLHKVVSNAVEVMEALPSEDRGKDLRDLDLRHDSLPAQRSLGVYWNLEKDAFTFRVSLPEKPFTRRGVLSIVNSIYDPLGLASPVLLEGRLLLQQLVHMGKKKNNDAPLGWDDPLPESLLDQWQQWRNSLNDLEKVFIPRCYHPPDFDTVSRAEIHAFSDASKDAIGVAIYLRILSCKGEVCTTLVLGQSRVAPMQTTSIPRLELCGAVLATQAVDKVLREIDMRIDDVVFYTDSKVVLGYIQNESRRFYVYVANRVQTIRRASKPSQWRYIDTNKNPADLATRRLKANKLVESDWLTGPNFLRDPSLALQEQEEIPLDDQDPEVHKGVTVLASSMRKPRSLGAERFSRFSTLTSLQRAVANLIVKLKEFKSRRIDISTKGSKEQEKSATDAKNKLRIPTVGELQQATNVITRAVQEDSFGHEFDIQRDIKAQEAKGGVPRTNRRKDELKRSDLCDLDPFVDEKGILRVGGRLRRAQLEYDEKHPILLPKGHHLSKLVVRHCHSQVHHQGRQITHGAIRQAGYWLVSGHRTVAKELSQCVVCKKLRGPPLKQQMADLPADRMEIAPPFTNVGFDVFGPWTIQTRRMRGGAAFSKRWGLVFTCLSSRAIHIEVLESMDTSAFICALRRFFAIRGPAALLRCDCGTNFIGAKSELDEALKEISDKQKVERFIKDQGCEWIFNPPHASHFGGVWERQIGTIRRVLDAMFAKLGAAQLTHELLVTLMSEVCAIVNARPITAVPTDTQDPQPLSPAMLLTMKTRPTGPPPGNFIPPDLYARSRWRRVQYLADQFWLRWRKEYLHTLQARSKWKQTQRNLEVGDIVLLQEDGTYRNEWPMARVSEAIKSDDNKVRKARVETARGGKKKTYLRPIKELILLIPASNTEPR